MDITLKISGKSKLNDSVWLAQGEASDGRAVYASLVQKGTNLVMQVNKHSQNQIGHHRVINWFGKGIVLADTAAKNGLEVSFKGVESDEIYVEQKADPKEANQKLISQVEQLTKLNKNKDALLNKLTKEVAQIKTTLNAQNKERDEKIEQLLKLNQEKDAALAAITKQLEGAKQ